jgi:hypothetical protein
VAAAVVLCGTLLLVHSPPPPRVIPLAFICQPLHFAITLGRVEMVRLLIANGARADTMVRNTTSRGVSCVIALGSGRMSGPWHSHTHTHIHAHLGRLGDAALGR